MHRTIAADAIHVDRDTLRRLAKHEAQLQATGGRELFDLRDSLMLFDPADPEPYWNRLVCPSWPADRGAFDRRLDEVITLFAARGRLAHIWPYPSENQPTDLVERLRAAGFESMGTDILMVLADPTAGGAHLAEPMAPEIQVETLEGVSAGTVRASAAVAEVLVDAFDVGDDRRAAIELETLGGLEGSVLHVTLARLRGWPAAAAKRSTLDGISYLSSIGTRYQARGRGLGSLVTALAVRDAVRAGSTLTYLKVDAANDVAQRLYRRLGFVPVAGTIADLLLRQ
jgi:ribosomal protein S18 acetylase RimI-like enzyme